MQRTFVALAVAVPLIAGIYAQQIPKTNFSCKGRNTGYYADISTGCQVYHMCDGLGRQFSYTCPNATLFQQRMLICDHWYMVNCSKAEDDYSANLLIGQKKPFVDDFIRTPRPDLLNPGESEYNIIYRTGRAQADAIKNVVGAEEKTNVEDGSSTEYSPPSHWSTEYADQVTTPSTISENRRVFQEPPLRPIRYYQTRYNTINKKVDDSSRSQAKAIDLDSVNKNSNTFLTDTKPRPFGVRPGAFKVNFQSNFKATTPVYPKSVEATSEAPNDVGLVPPGGLQDGTDTNKKAEFIINMPDVNFESNFKATTPNYPLFVEPSSPDPNDVGLLAPGNGKQQNQELSETSGFHVNFESNFKATTPVYPKSVEATSPNPDNIGLLAPQGSQNEELNEIAVNFESNFKATTPNYPTFVEPTSPDPNDIGLVAPRSSNENEEPLRRVNFESNFKATTPVYPKAVEPTSPDPNEFGLIPPKSQENPSEVLHVNFESNFKATTPNYPKFVEPTSPDPNEIGVVPPNSNGTNDKPLSESDKQSTVQVVPTLNLGFEPPSFDKTYFQREDVQPSVYYQPPRAQPDFTINKAIPVQVAGNGLFLKPDYTQRMKPEQWNMLREILHIPDYDFPLEPVVRPSYESSLSSFQAKSGKKR